MFKQELDMEIKVGKKINKVLHEDFGFEYNNNVPELLKKEIWK